MAAVPGWVVLVPFWFFESDVINPMVIWNGVENLELIFLTHRGHGSYMCYDHVNIFSTTHFMYILCDDFINFTFHVFGPLVWAAEKSKNSNMVVINE